MAGRKRRLRTARLQSLKELQTWVQTRAGYGRGGTVDEMADRLAQRIAEETEAQRGRRPANG